MDKLLRYKRPALYVALGLVVAITLVARFASSRQKGYERDFVQADLSLMQGSVQELETILKKHKELHAKYDGPIAQLFLKNKEPAAAQPYADEMFKRTASYARGYAEFSQASLLIENGNYSAALSRALTLQKTLAKEDESLLKLYNLLRIALLNQELGNEGDEKEAWSQLLEELGEKNTSTHQSFLDTFQSGDVSLLDYAETRI